jgi:hypothetical protein
VILAAYFGNALAFGCPRCVVSGAGLFETGLVRVLDVRLSINVAGRQKERRDHGECDENPGIHDLS